ncbi:MAG: hypothetical protein KBD48_00725 [Candidatus Pacebacteria bacterium]|nr:hypothetical protein [Candidatus Paceibacterota bacterium]MBP9715703.1 hypothetical protein [Candidatus Paceibacterota bacterium]
MNNKAYKNLIAFTFAFFVLAIANNAFAAVTSEERGSTNYNSYQSGYYMYNPGYSQPYSMNQSAGYNQVTPTYTQAPVYTQVAPTYQQPVQYIATPAVAQAPTVQYVQSDVPTTYVNTPSTSSTKSTTRVASNTTVKSTNTSNVSQSNTIPAENLGASAVNSTNNLTALSMNGTNSFMPDTVFEWFMTVVGILALIILIRVLFKKEGHGHH